MYNICLVVLACIAVVAGGKGASYPIPTPQQLAWSQREIGAIINWGMETSAFNVSDIGFCGGRTGFNGTNWLPEPSLFNPMFIDTDAWAEAIVSFGAKYAVLTAKHCSGFAIYPTKVPGYEFNIANSPYLDGQGDIVADFVRSCRKYGLDVGLYYHVGNNYYCNILLDHFLNQTLLPNQLNVTSEEYEKIVYAQVTELWSNYGELAEIWFDGGTFNYSEGLQALLTKLQPNAVTFQGPKGYPNVIRWVGTELGDAPYPCWSTANNSDAYGGGSIFPNSIWAPAESDTTIMNEDRWFWSPDYYTFGIKNVSTLFAQYEATVGRNTNFLLNLNPDPFGVLPPEDIIEYQKLGAAITQCYVKNLIAEVSGNASLTLSITFPPGKTQFNRIVISEDQTYGQRIRAYEIESIDENRFHNIANGTSVGNKRIEIFEPAVSASGVQLTITDYVDLPVIAKFAAYLC